jgi:hypothetical protein
MADDQQPEAPSTVPPWDEVEQHFRQAFPSLDPAEMRQRYQNALTLGAAHQQASATVEDSGGRENVFREMTPFVSAIGAAADERTYGNARQRYERGAPEPTDFETIARYERQQELQPQESLPQRLVRGVAGVGSVAGEVAMTGGLAGGLGGLAARGATAVGLGARAASVVGGATRLAALPAVVPSFGAAQELIHRNLGEGADALDLRNLPGAYAHSVLQAAVYEAVGKVPGAPSGTGAIATAGRMAHGGATFVAGQQAADTVSQLLPSWLGKDTGYGTIGRALDGHAGEELQNAIVQFISGAALAGIHETGRAHSREEINRAHEEVGRPLIEGLQGILNGSARAGMDPTQAAQVVHGLLADANQRATGNPDLTPAQAIEHAIGAIQTRFNDDAIAALGPDRFQERPPERPQTTPSPPEAQSGRQAVQEAPGAPEPAQGLVTDWHQTYADRRREGMGHEAATQAADLQHDQGQSWVHSGTEFSGPDRDHFTANGQTYRIDPRFWDAQTDLGGEHGGVRLGVKDAEGKEVGRVAFLRGADGSYSASGLQGDVHGVARALYDHMVEAGQRVVPSQEGRTGDGKDFWRKNAENAGNGEIGKHLAMMRERGQTEAATELESIIKDFPGRKAEIAAFLNSPEMERTFNEAHQRSRIQSGDDAASVRPTLGGGVQGGAPGPASANAPSGNPPGAAGPETQGGAQTVRPLRANLPATEAATAQRGQAGGNFVVSPEFQAAHQENIRAQDEAAQSGHPPAEIAASVRDGIQDADAATRAAEARAADEAPPTTEERQAAQAQVESGQRELAAWDSNPAKPPDSLFELKLPKPAEPPGGAGAGPRGTESGPNAGLWDVASHFAKEEGGFLDPQKIRDFAEAQYERLKVRMESLHDGFKRFAGAKFPNLTRIDRLSGEAGGAFDTAPDRARAAAPYFTDKMMGTKDHTDAQRNFIGATFNEWRLQYMKAAFYREVAAELARVQASGKPSARLGELLQAAKDVKSFLGTPGYAADQAAFQRDLNSSEFREFLARWSGKGGFAEIMEDNFRKAQGLDVNDPIDSKTQIPGFPVNLLGKENTPQVQGQPSAGKLQNTRLRQLPFSREATGSSDAYETDIGKIIENSLVRGTTLAAKAEFLRTMVNEGTGIFAKPDQRVEGATEIPNVKPPRGTQEAEPGQTSFYVRNEAAGEVRQSIQVDQPWKKIPGTQLLTGLNMIGFTEPIAHVMNNLTMMFKPGMWRQIPWMPATTWKVMRGNQEIMGRILDLAKEGVGFRAQHPTLLSKVVGDTAWDPTSWGGRFLDVMHKTMALTMEDAFNGLRDRGYAVDTITNKRDFINQLGNYSKKTQNGIVAFLRDTGINSTATATTNYTAQSLRALVGGTGLEATGPKAALMLRASMIARGAGILASVAAANFLRWGRLDGDDNTPLGAMKIGEKDGKTQYLDIFAYTPWGRGLRTTGAASLIEGQRAGARAGPTIDTAAERLIGSLVRPFVGAPVAFAQEAITGRNAIGRQVAPHAAQGESQAWQNLQAALWNANPAIGTLTGHNLPPLSHRREREMDWSQLFGPLGPKERNRPPGAEYQFRQVTVPVQGRRSLRR